MKISQATREVRNHHHLDAKTIEGIFYDIFTSGIPDQEIKDFLIALHHKGESFEEILGAAQYLKKNGESIRPGEHDLVDCCGTGGDQKNTFNISTAVAFVLAGGGCHVAKHGNRAVSSQSGSADILSELGIDIQTSKEITCKNIDEIGIGFLFAPQYYPLMKRVAAIRKSIPHRTIFNLLGPLINPAGAKRQLIGVFDKKYVPVMAQVLKELGSESVVVMHAKNGMDEFSLSCPNLVARLHQGEIKEFEFDPRESGYPYCTDEDLRGGTPRENAERLKLCLKGHSLPLDHTVHINAAWGFIAAGKAENFMDGLLLAQDSISSGRAYQKLEGLVTTRWLPLSS